jgi:hypothetical protein
LSISLRRRRLRPWPCTRRRVARADPMRCEDSRRRHPGDPTARAGPPRYCGPCVLELTRVQQRLNLVGAHCCCSGV